MLVVMAVLMPLARSCNVQEMDILKQRLEKSCMHCDHKELRGGCLSVVLHNMHNTQFPVRINFPCLLTCPTNTHQERLDCKSPCCLTATNALLKTCYTYTQLILSIYFLTQILVLLCPCDGK